MKDINKNVVALGIVSFFTDTASSMITSILPIFIVYILHEGIDKLGFIVALATFVSYAFRILFGYLSDRFNKAKPFVVAGYTLSALTKPLFYFANSWVQIAAIRGIERMGKAIRSATKDSLISSYSNGKSGKTFGFHKMMDVAGEMSGAAIAFLVLYYIGKSETVFRDIFAYSLVPGIFATIIVIFFVKDNASKHKSITYDIKSDYKLLPLLFTYFAFIFFIFNDSFFLIKAKESGISLEYIPLFMILLNFIQTITSLYIGIKVDTLGSKSILIISFFCGILSMVGLYLNFIIASFILLGIFLVGSLNALRAYISKHAINKGTIYGVLYAGVALFSSIGAAVVGLIWKNYGENQSIIFSIIGLICVTIILIFSQSKASILSKFRKL